MHTVRTLAFSLAGKDSMKVMQAGMDMMADRMPPAPANK